MNSERQYLQEFWINHFLFQGDNPFLFAGVQFLFKVET